MNILTRFMAKGTIHKRRTHTMGGGGLAKSVRFVDKGEGFRIVYVHIFQEVFLPKLLLHIIKKSANICEKIEEKIRTHKK